MGVGVTRPARRPGEAAVVPEPSQEILAAAVKVGHLQHEVDRLESLAHLGPFHKRQLRHMTTELTTERTAFEALKHGTR